MTYLLCGISFAIGAWVGFLICAILTIGDDNED